MGVVKDMKLIKITDKIIQIDFQTQEELAKTFLRFQEYYENPYFRGKIFTLEEFKEWYIEERGEFSYYKDWSGFNIPGYIFKPFFEGKFNPLTENEQKLMDLVREFPEDFYLIGTFNGGKENVLEHEICHGLYSTNLDYKMDVDALIEEYIQDHSWTHFIEIIGVLSRMGYHPSVIPDEIHAYISADEEWLKEEGIKYPKIGKGLRDIRRKYFK